MSKKSETEIRLIRLELMRRSLTDAIFGAALMVGIAALVAMLSVAKIIIDYSLVDGVVIDEKMVLNLGEMSIFITPIFLGFAISAGCKGIQSLSIFSQKIQ